MKINALGFEIPEKLDDLLKNRTVDFRELEKAVENYPMRGIPLGAWCSERHQLFKAALFYADMFGLKLSNQKELPHDKK